jgi:putative phage-type endonuclease
MLTQEQLEARRSGIGGSDIGALLGLSPFKTPLDIWLSKTGQAADTVQNEEAVYWGSVLEDVVARRYSELTDRKVQRINSMLRHQQYPIAIANIDRAVINPDIAGRVMVKDGRLTTDRILECKTANAFARRDDAWGEPGTDKVPDYYLTQVQWYMGITGATVADLAVLFGGQQHVTYTIAFDAELFADMIEQASEWWTKHVVNGIAPDPRTAAEARALWPQHVASKQVIVGVEVADAVAKLAQVKADMKAMESLASEYEAVILTAFGDAEEAICNGQKIATWKANKPSMRTDWKALVHHHWPIPPAELVEHFTAMTPGARVLRLAK